MLSKRTSVAERTEGVRVLTRENSAEVSSARSSDRSSRSTAGVPFPSAVAATETGKSAAGAPPVVKRTDNASSPAATLVGREDLGRCTCMARVQQDSYRAELDPRATQLGYQPAVGAANLASIPRSVRTARSGLPQPLARSPGAGQSDASLFSQ